ncbi:M16 family metallopeptidase [Novosphingobium tardum]|uniref:M16 family metallopeptidase n=1 Tax=Novosphingobium tardum TaxID=1538021 RepID=A0ABV8RPR0_9SPHN
MRFARLLPFAALLLAACSAQPRHLASAPAAPAPTWAFEKADLPVDPAFRFGVLPNGMRYIIRQNATPKGTALVRMDIQAGSLDERDDERGYAHFIEHMAFNGSTNVKEGEMVALLERNGLAFGADTNASTGFEQTQYKLDLPRNDPALLDIALMLMRETASELTFDPAAVQRERGVVMSELRDSLSFARRNLEDQIAFLYPGALYPQRLPIGVPETLNAATAERLRAVWAREYTPRDTTLVVVGDFDPALVERKIVERFAGWQAAPVNPRPDEGTVDPKRKGLTDIFIDPAVSERVAVSRHGPWLDEPDSIANRRTALLREIGYGIINRRLQRLSRQASPPFRAAGFGTSEVFKIGRTTNLIVDTVDGGWKPGIEAAAKEYSRALATGFTQAEIDEQVANIRTSAQNLAAASATRSNAALTAGALALVDDEQVPTTPESSLARFEAFAPSITPAAVMAALRTEAIVLKDPLIRFQGRTPPAGGAAAIRAAWDKSARMKANVQAGGESAAFAYTDFGAPGTVVYDAREPLLGIRTIRFANNVMLNLKRTEIERDRVRVNLAVDGGEMLDTRANPHATEMTGFLTAGGLGKHSQDDLQSILAGRTVGGGLSASGDTFSTAAVTTPRDLQLELQLLAAYLTDPGYRPEGEEQFKLNIANFFAQSKATPGSALATAQGAILSAGDPRFSLGNPADYQGLSFAQLRNDIGDRLNRGAIEIGIVGDIDEEQAIALVAKTFGALPEREAKFGAWPQSRERTFTTQRGLTVVRHSGDPSQSIVRVVWPTRDDSDALETAKLELLEKVTAIELLDGIRERLGKSYSPGASASNSRVYKGYGTFTLTASVNAADVPETRSAIDAIVADLRRAPVADDVLQRARAPMIDALDNALKSNAGWMSLVDRAQTESDRIERYQQARGRLLSLTAADVQATAQRYLLAGKEVTIVVLPNGATTPQAAR